MKHWVKPAGKKLAKTFGIRITDMQTYFIRIYGYIGQRHITFLTKTKSTSTRIKNTRCW